MTRTSAIILFAVGIFSLSASSAWPHGGMGGGHGGFGGGFSHGTIGAPGGGAGGGFAHFTAAGHPGFYGPHGHGHFHNRVFVRDDIFFGGPFWYGDDYYTDNNCYRKVWTRWGWTWAWVCN